MRFPPIAGRDFVASDSKGLVQSSPAETCDLTMVVVRAVVEQYHRGGRTGRGGNWLDGPASQETGRDLLDYIHHFAEVRVESESRLPLQNARWRTLFQPRRKLTAIRLAALNGIPLPTVWRHARGPACREAVGIVLEIRS